MIFKIALFGEAEKGHFHSPYSFHSVELLLDTLGNPPKDSQGICMAIQALMYKCHLIFFRVEEEGFSLNDYMQGLIFLENKKIINKLHALAIPGVGDAKIIDSTKKVCDLYKSLLIITEKDFYDYLTSKSFN